jgi:hypothetical protein
VNRLKCRLQSYDPKVKEAPFTFITRGEITIDVPDVKDNGETLWGILFDACRDAGFYFRFYSMSSEPGYTYDVNVRN